MKVVCLVSWYDEQPATLERAILSLPKAHVRHVVALDGAYGLFPDGKAKSPQAQVRAMRAACKVNALKFTVEQPETTWADNEVEKRSRLFALAETVTTENDWYFILDADESIRSAPTDLIPRLETTDMHVGELTYYESKRQTAFPKFFRALRGLTVLDNHYSYCTPDGQRLWGHSPQGPLAKRLSLLDMYVQHHLEERTFEREAGKRAYYKQRDDLGIEIPSNVRHPPHPPHGALAHGR